MKIFNHLLFLNDNTQATFRPSPNRGATLDPRYLVIHYTAGQSVSSTVQWFLNPVAQASAHLVIGRDGSITQMVPFDKIAWHAGRSSWEGLDGINKYAIGIELDNMGKLTRQNNQWTTWFKRRVPEEEVLVAKHKNDTETAGWHIYTSEQLDVAVEVAALLVQHYQLKDVVGHEDISPYRKSDPGPAFPMFSFESKVIGRRDEEWPVFVTTALLNIRQGPAPSFPTMPEGPLPEGTPVLSIKTEQGWHLVEVSTPIRQVRGLQGWVNGRYLRRV